MSDKKGFYLSVDGLDGSGKSTIVNAVAAWMGLDQTVMTRMPGGTPFAEEHRSACRSADIDEGTQLLFYSALNRDASVKTVKPTIAQGYNVVADRGWTSTLVYQAMTSGNEKLLLKIVEDEMIPMPDLVIYLDIPLEASIARENKRVVQATEEVQDDRYSKFSRYHKEKIKEGYDIFFNLPLETNHYQTKVDNDRPRDEFAVMWKLRHRLAKKVAIVNADQPLGNVIADVIRAIEEHKHDKAV